MAKKAVLRMMMTMMMWDREREDNLNSGEK
jgi:hypothetical protein